MQTPHTRVEPTTFPSASASPRAAAREVLVVAPGGGEAWWFLDNLIVLKCSGTGGAPYALAETLLPAGSRTPFHLHHDEDEAFFVLEGELTIFIEDTPGQVRQVRGTPGAYVHIPQGIAHGYRTDSPVRMLVITGTDGFIELARAAGTPALRRELPPAAEPDVAALGALAPKFRIALLGPLPES
jgi:quercetin dioxygenase-like cupin family protein